MTRLLLAWLAFAAGVLLMLADILHLVVSGRFLLGVVLLVVWAWGIGAFRRDSWVRTIDDSHPDALGSLDLRDRAGRSPHLPPDAKPPSDAASSTDATS